jgi:hypothetical protein
MDSEPMSFLDKYKVEAVKVSGGAASRLSAEEKVRRKMREMITHQIGLAEAQQSGTNYTFTRNGKSVAPRAFWKGVPGGLVFMPRYGNESLFGDSKGVVVKDIKALIAVLKDFSSAVDKGEFDSPMLKIAGSRAQRLAGGRKVGRPRKTR